MTIKLSACTIVKNEERNIGKSIDSYKDYVDEIIIVDTGSTDNTKEIAESKGAKVLDFEWKNDFSAAKNFALDNTTGDWIIFLDADEWFAEDTAKNIREAIINTQKLNYSAIACKLVNFFTETEVMEVASTIRIFKKADNIRFCRAIHEALFDTNDNLALPGLYSDLLTINHSGYMKDVAKQKAKRNNELLERAFASGEASYIDYFYGMRENIPGNLEVSEYFYKLIENTPNYDELVSSFNISSTIDENKFKLVNALPNKYSLDYKIKLLEDIQKKYDKNPTFKFYEYVLFVNIDKKRAIKALQDAMEFEKDFEKDNLASSNPFYAKRSEVCFILGEYYMFLNDKVKALDYFVQAIKADYENIKSIVGALNIIKDEATEDKIIFINSILDIENKEKEKLLIDVLRLTEFKEVFLYYFVDYYKKYDEVERAFFTSRLLTGNFEEVVDKYISVYKESKDERAIMMVSAALIAGNCKEKFESVKNDITYTYSKILHSYFGNTEEIFDDVENKALLDIFKEIAYVANIDTIKQIIAISGSFKDNLCFKMIEYYYSKYSYEYVLKLLSELEIEGNLSYKFISYSNYLKTKIYFSTNKFEEISETLDKVIYDGILDQDIVLICEMLEASDEKLQEYFSLLDSFNFARVNLPLDIIQDIGSDSIKFMTIDKFEEETNSRLICMFDEHEKIFTDFAKKCKDNKAFIIAEKYYKILIKYKKMVSESYFALGEIYNSLNKPELSFYCYEKAFIEDFALAKKILPKGHVNANYIFSKKEENKLEICPICGGTSRLIATYVNIFDKNLTYNEPLIVKYRSCNECSHIFAENDITNKCYWEANICKNISDDKISASYDILESVYEITDGNNILDFSKDNGEFEMAARNYGFNIEKSSSGNIVDIIFAGDVLSISDDIFNIMGKYTKSISEDGIMIFEMYDEGNAFSKLADRPYWARAGVKNVFSKKSMEILFNKFNLQVLQLNIDKVNKGKVLVIVGR